MDPTLISSTGTPEDGGFDIDQINTLFDMLSNHNVVSMDVVEFNPHLGDFIKSYQHLSSILSRFLNKLL